MQRFFPAEYRVILPGADDPRRAQPTTDGAVRILFVDDEERAALRLFLRALRRLDADIGVGGDDRLRARAVEQHAAARRPRKARDLRDARGAAARPRRWRTPTSSSPPPTAPRPRPGSLLRALNAQASCSPRGCRSTRRRSTTATYGLLFEPRDIDTLAAQLQKLVDDAALRQQPRRAGRVRCASSLSWARVADELEDVYAGLTARRHSLHRQRRDRRAPAHAATHRRRPAHAHRPLARLRDAGRGAARDRPRPRTRRDRRHRPQRHHRRARGSREGRRSSASRSSSPRRSRPPTRARSSGSSSRSTSRAA